MMKVSEAGAGRRVGWGGCARVGVVLLLAACFATPAAVAAERLYLTPAEALTRHFPPPASTAPKVAWLTPAQATEIERRGGEPARRVVPYYEARHDSELIGYAFVDDVIGRSEPITYLVALTPEAAVVGVDLLTFRESHGYEVERQGWRDQFHGRRLAPELQLGRAIDSISGATLSARALTRGIRRLLATAEVVLGGRD